MGWTSLGCVQVFVYIISQLKSTKKRIADDELFLSPSMFGLGKAAYIVDHSTNAHPHRAAHLIPHTLVDRALNALSVE